MAQSQRLTLADVRAVFRLIGECRELGVDSNLWRRHMLVELLRLTGGQVAMGGPVAFDADYVDADRPPTIELGWEGEHEQSRFYDFMRDGMPQKDPLLLAAAARLVNLQKPPGRLTYCRRQLVDDAAWYRSEAYCDYRRVSRVDDALMSYAALPDGDVHAIVLQRAVDGGRFAGRGRRLLHLFHAELAPFLWRDLAPPGRDPVSLLSPRLRQVLGALLEGDSERQIALRLGLTANTAHQYVKAIYRRLGVNTRAELMAVFIRFPEAARNDDPNRTL